MRKAVTITIGLAVLILSPVAIWWSVTPHYSYGDAELRAAVEGTWQLTTTTGRNLTFTIRQAKETERTHASRGLVQSAAACGHRTLVRSAEACMDVSDMPLVVAAVSGATGTGTGQLFVAGTTFERGKLEASVGDLWIEADVAPDGKATRASMHGGDGHSLDAKLVRVACQ